MTQFELTMNDNNEWDRVQEILVEMRDDRIKHNNHCAGHCFFQEALTVVRHSQLTADDLAMMEQNVHTYRADIEADYYGEPLDHSEQGAW